MTSVPAATRFNAFHLSRSGPLRVRAEALPDGWVVVAEGRDESRRFRLRHQGRTRPLPEALDAIAFCALPLALRTGQMLHVEGALTRSALRNLRELGETWASWQPGVFAAADVACDRILDDLPPQEGPVIAAWSGDLRSTFTIAGGDAALREAGWRIGTAVHVTGLAAPVADAAALRRMADAIRSAGIDWALVSTDAAAAGFVDPVIGPTPIVAAALHLVGDGVAPIAVHAASRPVRAHLIRPRRQPSPGNFQSGDRLQVLSVGGVAALPQIVSWLAARPELRPLLLGCRAGGFAPPRCGSCDDCQRLDLGLRAAGLRLEGDRGPGPLRTGDPDLETEGILALDGWTGGAGGRLRLAAQLAAARIGRTRRDRSIWRKAMRGEAEPWPR